jgi:hypothetical protein
VLLAVVDGLKGFPDAIQAVFPEAIYRDMEFPLTTSTSTVQRLMKIELERKRRQREVATQANLSALRLGDTAATGWGQMTAQGFAALGLGWWIWFWPAAAIVMVSGLVVQVATPNSGGRRAVPMMTAEAASCSCHPQRDINRHQVRRGLGARPARQPSRAITPSYQAGRIASRS